MLKRLAILAVLAAAQAPAPVSAPAPGQASKPPSTARPAPSNVLNSSDSPAVATPSAAVRAPAPVPGQASRSPGSAHPVPSNTAKGDKNPPTAAHPSASLHDAGSLGGKNGFEEGSNEPRQPIVVTIPAPVPQPWSLRERISWGANLVLVFLGYIGVILALRTLKVIERQTKSGEGAAQAALESAHLALLHAQAVIDSERPWLLIAAEPSRTIQNCFNVIATNRGRTPAKIVAVSNQVRVAIDERHLPKIPEYKNAESDTLAVPITLLPGESTDIRRVSLDDVNRMQLVLWEDRAFVYGKVAYRDLVAPADKQVYETGWCCWFIYRDEKSDLVLAGPPEYHLHT